MTVYTVTIYTVTVYTVSHTGVSTPDPLLKPGLQVPSLSVFPRGPSRDASQSTPQPQVEAVGAQQSPVPCQVGTCGEGGGEAQAARRAAEPMGSPLRARSQRTFSALPQATLPRMTSQVGAASLAHVSGF